MFNKIKKSHGERFVNSFLYIINGLHFPIILLGFMVLSATCIYAKVLSPIFFSIGLGIFGTTILRMTIKKNRKELVFATRIFMFLFCFSMIVTCLIYIYYMQRFGVPYESGGTDDARFERQANVLLASKITSYEAAKEIIRLEGTGTWHAAEHYVIVVALVHQLAESVELVSHTLNPRLLNGFILAIIAVLVWRVARRCCKQEATARFAGYYSGLLPSVVFVAAHIYRDVLISFGLILILLITIYILDCFRIALTSSRIMKIIRAIIALIFCCIFTASFREWLWVPIAFMIGLVVFSQVKLLYIKISILLLLASCVGITVAYGALDHFMNQAESYTRYYTEYKAGMGSESGFGTGIYRLPYFLSYPLRVVYASINPLPFPSGYISENFRRVGTLIWFFSLPFLVNSLFGCLKKSHDIRVRYRRSVAVAFVIFYLAYALLTLQARQILMYSPLGAILIASGIEESKRSTSFYFYVMTSFGLLMLIIYGAFKLL